MTTFEFFSSAAYGYHLELRSPSGVVVVIPNKTKDHDLNTLINILYLSRNFLEMVEHPIEKHITSATLIEGVQEGLDRAYEVWSEKNGVEL